MRYWNSVFPVWFLFWLFFSLVPGWADAPKPAVSFSPTVIDFGMVPSNTQCTQLVTVTFDRRVFSPEHLPTLVPDRSSQAEVSLFARFDDPKFIRVVYCVTVDALYQVGPFQDRLALVNNQQEPDADPVTLAAENAGISVVGESVQGLEATSQISFGEVKVGETRTKMLDVGFYTPDILGMDTMPKPSQKSQFPHPTGLNDLSVTSSSPFLTAKKFADTSINATIRQTWTVTLSSRLPLGMMYAELQFRSKDGYCKTVRVNAYIIAPSKPEPRRAKKH